MTKAVLLSTFLVVLTVLRATASSSIKGAVPLDEYNFDRVISRFDTVLVKFDAVYPFGDKHEAFKSVAEELKSSNDILFVEIPIKDFGDHDNQKLAERFRVKTKNDWPALRLFVKGEDEPFAFNNNVLWTVDEIKKFVKEHSNVYLGLQGCLEAFDKLAAEFAGTRDKKAVLASAEKLAESLTVENDKKVANTYIKYMQKALEKPSFVNDEKKRLNKIIKDGKVKADKKQDLQVRANILASFNMAKSEL